MGYASWSVVFGEQPSAAKWNILGTNDASFNDGTGIGANAITTTKIINDAVTAAKLIYGMGFSRRGGSATDWTDSSGTTDYDISGTDLKFVFVTTPVNANPTTVGFGVTFAQKPIVIASTFGAATNNVYTIVLTVTTSQCTLRQVTDAGVAATTEKAMLFVAGVA